MTGIAEFPSILKRFSVGYRRHRLTMAYVSVSRRRTGRGPGFSSLIGAYEQMDRDGVISWDDEGFEWQWPGDA